jgi:hypothetical protein
VKRSSSEALFKQREAPLRSSRPAGPLSFYFPPNASSEMSTAALLVIKIAFILPKVTGNTLVVKNSTLFS